MSRGFMKTGLWTERENSILKSGIDAGETLYQIGQCLPGRNSLGIILHARELIGVAKRFAHDSRFEKMKENPILTMREVFPDRDRMWSDSDEQILLDLFKCGQSTLDISIRLERTEKGVLEHIKKAFLDNQLHKNKFFDFAIGRIERI